ncbi:hypothetical protein [Propionivibrio soli]|uniref:hypothetical protein n=1 Tax=Propionivibrio soli TaxID=2976531 RepID=UPI0021E7B01D|nr:hypothetical protein [Propionivibrio soli]
MPYGPKAMPGLRRHVTHLPRSDGTTNGKLVEVKTISPEKSSDVVLVKRQGDFMQLLIVRIDQDFQFKSKLRQGRTQGSGRPVSLRASQG